MSDRDELRQAVARVIAERLSFNSTDEVEAAADAAIAAYEAHRPRPANSLVEFARWAIAEGAWQGGDLEGGDIQNKAHKLGLIELVPGGYNPEVHGEDDYAELGDPYFTFAPILQKENKHPLLPEGE